MTAGIDYGSFESTLEKFVNTLEWVIPEVDIVNDTGSSAGPADNNNNNPPPPDGGMGIMV